MTTLYLIAHKVRGEAAFDVAERLRCPICQGLDWRPNNDDTGTTCDECDAGFWWIISTSGHRAHPLMHWPLHLLSSITPSAHAAGLGGIYEDIGAMESDPNWPALPDHYPLNTSPKAPARDIVALLGLDKPKTIAPGTFKRLSQS